MKRFYNFETMFGSLKDALGAFLKTQGIYYEVSGCFDGWHFEIKADEAEVEMVNRWLDENTIVCR